MADDTRDRILTAAIDLLQRTGSSDFSMERLAEWSGVSRKTIYNHFESRAHLVNEAIISGMERIVARLRAIVDDTTMGFARKLDRIVEQGFRETRRLWEPPYAPGAAPASMKIVTTGKQLNDHLLALIRRIVKEAAEKGFIDARTDASLLAHVIMNVIAGIRTHDDPSLLPCTPLELLQESLRVLLFGSLSRRGRQSLKMTRALHGSGDLL